MRQCPVCGHGLSDADYYIATQKYLKCKTLGCKISLGDYVYYADAPGEEEVPVVKHEEDLVPINKGDNILALTFHRDSVGLKMYVQAHPALEQFVRSLGNGSTKPLESFPGKIWYALKGDEPIQIYSLTVDMSNVSGFRLDLPGGVLEDPEGRVNLSFLRAKGISSEGGVRFAVAGVYSLDRLKRLEGRIGDACKRLYEDFINPSKLMVVISTKDI